MQESWQHIFFPLITISYTVVLPVVESQAENAVVNASSDTHVSISTT